MVMTTGTLTFTATSPRAVTDARHLLTQQLEQWDCGRIEDAVLVFSELATNAVKHAGGATNIVVAVGDETLRIEVSDDTHIEPTVRHDAPGGFGLRIVAELGDRWGWSQTRRGKVVWCELPCWLDDDPVVHGLRGE
jgi:anti-sigma regulatory factor (Ser/Thr protein kinase)